jgi:hypothetical protein
VRATNCDICKRVLTDTVVDGKTKNGQWANMCPLCALLESVKLGLGRGQKYTRTKNTDWTKVAG